MIIPEAVILAAGEFVEQYGARFDYLGGYKDFGVWVFLFPAIENTGFPYVYLYKDVKVEEISGWFALDIISSINDN
ncbi:MAG: hypothetical protein IJL58_04815 [Bacteroidales bacterium]|nr:hypothetical protein [Bacteroidales bacterium]